MTTAVKPQSILSTGCFYSAGYLCLGALMVLGYQGLLWYREGAWLSYRMWVLLSWIGLDHSPAAPFTKIQPMFDHVWQSVGNCPITIALSLATAVIACIGFLRESAYVRAMQLKNAH
jgi:hypothetical protein